MKKFDLFFISGWKIMAFKPELGDTHWQFNNSLIWHGMIPNHSCFIT